MINKLLSNKNYLEIIDKINNLEANRKFCKHGLEHALDVARIGYIINLEEKLNYEKEMIYLAAFLHDIGRGNNIDGVSHHQSGQDIAYNILLDIEYPEDKIEIICNAIKNHKYVIEGKGLDFLIFKADKLSRACYKCNAIDECYWEWETKNITLNY